MSAELTRKVRNLAGTAVLNFVKTTAKSVRYLQLAMRDGFLLDEVEHLEPFGFTSGPIDGSEPVYLSLGGNRSKTVVILVHDRRYRMVVKAGECAIYNEHGDHIHLKDNRTIVAKSAAKVILDTPLTECMQDLKVHGDAEILGASKADDHISDGVSGKGHDHSGDSGGTTGGPNQ